MKLIASQTLTTTAASMEFTNIPQTFTDLYVVFSLRVSTANISQDTFLIFNNIGDAGYTARFLYGNGSSATSFTKNTTESVTINGNNSTANTFGSGSLYITNYAGATAKSFSIDNITENNASSADARIVAGLWSNTSAINRIAFFPGGSNIIAGSRISLYGITKGSDGIVTTS